MRSSDPWGLPEVPRAEVPRMFLALNLKNGPLADGGASKSAGEPSCCSGRAASAIGLGRCKPTESDSPPQTRLERLAVSVDAPVDPETAGAPEATIDGCPWAGSAALLAISDQDAATVSLIVGPAVSTTTGSQFMANSDGSEHSTLLVAVALLDGVKLWNAATASSLDALLRSSVA